MSDPKPTIHHHDCLTGETTLREITQEEHEELIAAAQNSAIDLTQFPPALQTPDD
jgi:hypothetical protein